MSRGHHETEIKLPMSNANAGRRMLRAAGFLVVKRRVFEANTVFDTPRQTLAKSSRLLRIRQAGSVRTLTYKGAPTPSKHKSREERELTVSDAGTMAVIVERLGFRPMFRYEKYRTEYQQPGRQGVAMLDETPIGVYLELEGTPAWIDRTARLLSFTEEAYITQSYGALYRSWCRGNHIKPSNMVFAERGTSGSPGHA
jgi:adenylate cyclase class 2